MCNVQCAMCNSNKLWTNAYVGYVYNEKHEQTIIIEKFLKKVLTTKEQSAIIVKLSKNSGFQNKMKKTLKKV